MQKLYKKIAIILCAYFSCALFFACDDFKDWKPPDDPTYWYSFADSGFIAAPKTPTALNVETENEIKEVYLAELVEKYSSELYGSNNPWSQLTLDEVWVGDYYGTYNGCAVVAPYHKYMKPAEGVYINCEYEVVVAGVAFLYTHLNYGYISVYNQGKLCDLKAAYDTGLLTKSDLQNIAYFLNHGQSFLQRAPKRPVNQKIIWDGNLNQEFSENEVIMVMDKNYTDWRFYAKDFIGVNVVAVESLMVLRLINPNSQFINREDWQDIIMITIGNSGKQNVINAIRELEKLDFVMAAEPNYYMELAN